MNHAPEPRREIPVPEGLLDQIHQALAEIRERAARRNGYTPEPHAPVLVVIDETHDFDRFAPVSAAWHAQVAEILNQGRSVRLRPTLPALRTAPDAEPIRPRPSGHDPAARSLNATPVTARTFEAITAEVVRAIAKHGLTHSPINPDTPPGECLAMLVEEVGELAHTLTYDADPAALDGELVQVAAVAAMWLQARADARASTSTDDRGRTLLADITAVLDQAPRMHTQEALRQLATAHPSYRDWTLHRLARALSDAGAPAYKSNGRMVVSRERVRAALADKPPRPNDRRPPRCAAGARP